MRRIVDSVSIAVVTWSGLCLFVSGMCFGVDARTQGSESVTKQQVLDVLLDQNISFWIKDEEKAARLSLMGTDAALLSAELMLSGQVSHTDVLPILRKLKAPETVRTLLVFLQEEGRSSNAAYHVLQALLDYGGAASVSDAIRLMSNGDNPVSIRLAAARIGLRYGNGENQEEARKFIEATWHERQDSLFHPPFPYEPEAWDLNQIILSAWDLHEPAIQHDVLEWLDEEDALTWNDFGVLQELYDPSIERFKTILLKSISSDTFIGNYSTLVPDAIELVLDGFPEVKKSDELMAQLRERYMANFRGYEGIFEDPQTAYPELYRELFG